MAQVLCYDIDGVLTREADTNHADLSGTYANRTPVERVRRQILSAIRAGWTIVLFTGRREAQRRITEDWLNQHGFHYHYLFMGKPYYSVIVDDRARSLDQVDSLLGIVTGDRIAKPEERPKVGEKEPDFGKLEAIAEACATLDFSALTEIGFEINDLTRKSIEAQDDVKIKEMQLISAVVEAYRNAIRRRTEQYKERKQPGA